MIKEKKKTELEMNTYNLTRCNNYIEHTDKYIYIMRNLSNSVYFNKKIVYNNHQIRNEVILKIYYFFNSKYYSKNLL